MMSSELTISHNGVDLMIRRHGSGRPIVLVHGHGTNLLSWRALTALLESDYMVVSYDRRGHGRSTGGNSFTIDALAADLRAVVHGLDLKDPLLIGHSVGCWEVLTYASSESAAGVICLDHAIATRDPFWTTVYGRSSRSVDTSPPPERVLTNAELAALSPMVQRSVEMTADGHARLRPTARVARLIEAGWATVGDEPYDQIRCAAVVMLAERNTGPVHDMLCRLVARRGLRAIMVDSDHDIQVERPGAVVRVVHEVLG